jgi:hypothetical protein
VTKKTGRKLAQALLRATRAADESVGLVSNQGSNSARAAYRRTVAQVMASIFMELLAYVWRQHPALEERFTEIAEATPSHQLPATPGIGPLGSRRLELVQADLTAVRTIVTRECASGEIECLLERIGRFENAVAEARQVVGAL